MMAAMMGDAILGTGRPDARGVDLPDAASDSITGGPQRGLTRAAAHSSSPQNACMRTAGVWTVCKKGHTLDYFSYMHQNHTSASFECVLAMKKTSGLMVTSQGLL